jgi:hypothetical protein|eukprot:CAMPEP_0174380514 /NCGR_PEP_ID=MMETSP0811_2-20130205/123424_1 /TAXON_ID=73025 ORGANISM="Eutreptiella gymnastica-like, Strain CCMP1594" /NCGR_SAMPLE_ID=MMETSP0811_2 /ASSEMBLY_ACC=CAM_ASM_000667 /LENGTH=167 /DNA_ID=CAMNT_0015533411 /DNA_START=12 /DNA_END=515 /DNA_ORIENTATION=+
MFIHVDYKRMHAPTLPACRRTLLQASKASHFHAAPTDVKATSSWLQTKKMQANVIFANKSGMLGRVIALEYKFSKILREEFKDISPQLLSTGGVTPLLIKDPVADALDRFLRKDYYPRVVDDQIRSTFQVAYATLMQMLQHRQEKVFSDVLLTVISSRLDAPEVGNV